MTANLDSTTAENSRKTENKLAGATLSLTFPAGDEEDEKPSKRLMKKKGIEREG